MREQGTEGYDFGHDKIREVAYRELSAARRRLLHRRVAQALETVHAADLDAVRAQLATHYEAAGQLEQALSHYEAAASVAQRLYANSQAIQHLRRAIALLPTASLDAARATRLYERLGDAWALTGEHAAARGVYEQAITRASEKDQLRRARFQRKLANTWRSQQRYDQARAAYDQAIQVLGPAPELPDTDWRQAWLDVQLDLVDLFYFQSRLTELAELCEKLHPRVAAYGSPRQQASYYAALNKLHHRQSRYRPSAKTVPLAQAALEWARKTDDRQLVGHQMFSMGFVLLWRGDLEAATEQLTAALSQAEQTGNLPLRDRCLA